MGITTDVDEILLAIFWLGIFLYARKIVDPPLPKFSAVGSLIDKVAGPLTGKEPSLPDHTQEVIELKPQNPSTLPVVGAA